MRFVLAYLFHYLRYLDDKMAERMAHAMRNDLVGGSIAAQARFILESFKQLQSAILHLHIPVVEHFLRSTEQGIEFYRRLTEKRMRKQKLNIKPSQSEVMSALRDELMMRSTSLIRTLWNPLVLTTGNNFWDDGSRDNIEYYLHIMIFLVQCFSGVAVLTSGSGINVHGTLTIFQESSDPHAAHDENGVWPELSVEIDEHTFRDGAFGVDKNSPNSAVFLTEYVPDVAESARADADVEITQVAAENPHSVPPIPLADFKFQATPLRRRSEFPETGGHGIGEKLLGDIKDAENQSRDKIAQTTAKLSAAVLQPQGRPGDAELLSYCNSFKTRSLSSITCCRSAIVLPISYFSCARRC